MARFNSEETLWAVFPMILVIILLIAGILLLPETPADVRSRASNPTPTVIAPVPNRSQAPEIVCSQLYSPVCGINNGQTYANSCEANLAGTSSFTTGTCSSSLRGGTTRQSPTPTKSTPLQYTLPDTNR